MSYILQKNQSKTAFSHHALLSLFRKELIFALLLLATAVPAVMAQDYYVIAAGNNFLSHNAALNGGLGNATSFDATTCLWTIDGNQIIAINPIGETGYKLGYTSSGNNAQRTYSLRLTNNTDTWTSATSEPYITYTYGTRPQTTAYYYLRYNSGWGMANQNTRATVTKLTFSDAPNTSSTSSTSYSATLNGDGVIYSTSGTHTYNANITQLVTYAQTSRTFGDYGSVNITRDFPVSSTYEGSVTNVSWSVDANSYGASITNGGVLSISSLPATFGYITLHYSARVGGETLNGSMEVTLFASEAAMQSYVLTIDDREDHNWTYYQATGPDGQYPPELRSPNPRNVKITYRGGSVANASAVAVSSDPGETHNTFVYYKTIERLAWGNSTGRWLEGEYAYQVIPNPFSKRPRTNGTTGTNGFHGFGGWKIISGGEYIAGHNNNDVLGLEEIINFTGLDAGYTPNCTSAEVVFEATWTAATVVTVNTNVTGDNGLPDGGTYETNFIVLSGDNRTVSGLSRNVTIMGRYPDGSNPTGARVTSFTTGANNAKIEYVKIGDGTTPVHPTSPSVLSSTGIGSGTFTAGGEGWLIVGRGCTGTVNYVCSSGSGGKYNYRIESGKYQFMTPLSASSASNSDNNYARIILGCDYDRVSDDGIAGNGTGDNTKLRIVNYISRSANGAYGSGSSEIVDITVKSGYYGFSANTSLYSNNQSPDGYGLGIGGNTDGYGGSYTTKGPDNNNFTYNLNSATVANHAWERNMSFYVGPTRNGGKEGVGRILIEGGEFCNINGGGANPGSGDIIGFHLRMKGGWVKGAIYGTASISNSTGSRKLVFTGGEINGWVAGGCNGTDFGNGQGTNTGTCYIYAGGTAEFRSHGKDGIYNNAYGLVFNVPGGQIFGAGRGLAPDPGDNTANRRYCGSTTTAYVVMADEAEVEQNVYGGGYNGVSQASHVYVTGGTVKGKVFGGTARAISTDGTWRCNTTDVRMYGGTVLGGVYGSHDEAGNQYNNVNVQILGGTVGAENQKLADNSRNHDLGNVFGCGFGEGTSVDGDVVVIIGDSINSTTHTDQPTIWGNVFGGGHEANYTQTGHTFKVLGYNGTVKESIFGGGKGVLNQEKGKITGNTNVWLKGFIHVINNVYGGGLAGVVTGNTNVKLSD